MYKSIIVSCLLISLAISNPVAITERDLGQSADLEVREPGPGIWVKDTVAPKVEERQSGSLNYTALLNLFNEILAQGSLSTSGSATKSKRLFDVTDLESIVEELEDEVESLGGSTKSKRQLDLTDVTAIIAELQAAAAAAAAAAEAGFK